MHRHLTRFAAPFLAAGVCAACIVAPLPTAATPATTTPTVPTGPMPTGNDAQAWLEAHNRWRASVNAAPLVWSAQLADYAQGYAEVIAKQGEEWPEHSTGPHGENLFFLTAPETPTADEAVDRWGEERAGYHPATRTCDGGWENCGHYTQLIWPSTTSVGCAVAESKGAWRWYVVCNYDPPGNVGVQ